ncbi:MAG: hypothetical protein P8L22_01190 [Acidimicrobiales bacterium]|nr:hypothetical protein [Acidimicrobiales bacterium]
MKDQFLELSEINLSPVAKPLKVLFLGDDEHPANTVIDYIQSFLSESSHEISLINPINSECPENLSKEEYDAIIIHYSICITEPYFLSTNWIKSITHFNGVKIQIIQDEYRWINKMKTQMRCLGIQAVFSSLTPENAEKVYCGDFMSKTKIISCLPGYFSKRLLDLPHVSLEQREYDVIYRGRDLPWSTGEHAVFKREIGQNFISWSKTYDLKADIQTKESKRIYGDAWDNFLLNGRTMIGIEGGASLFDFDGNLKESLELFESKNPESDPSKYWEEHLKPFEGNIIHKTITPKIFEAIASRTALILIPGEYRGILEPNRHYIPLMEDGSNFDEVINKIKDHNFLAELAETTFEEITSKTDLTYKFLVDKADQIISYLEENPSKANAETYFREKAVSQNLEIENLLKQIEESQQSASSLENKRTELENERTQLGHDRTQLENERTQVETQLENERTQLENERIHFETELENERSQLENERTQLEKDRIEAENELSQVETQLENERSEFENERTQLENELRQVETQLENKRSQIDTLQRQLQELKNPFRLGLFWMTKLWTKATRKFRLGAHTGSTQK